MPRIIEIIVTPKGETTLQTKGYTGSDCIQASKFLEQALGVGVREQHTSEFFESATVEQQVKQ